IEELSRIIGEPITDRELINQFLREHGTGKEPFTVNHTDVPDLTAHLNAEKALLITFTEEYGSVTITMHLMEGNTGTTLKKEDVKGILGEFPKLEKKLLDALLGFLGFLGDPQIQKKSAEGPHCGLGSVVSFGQGLDFLEKDSLENAARYFYRASTLDPTLTSTQQQLKQVFNRAEEKFVEPAEIGTVYLKGRELAKARYYFSEALNQNLTDIKGLFGMGQILLEENNLEKASQNLRSVLELDGNNREALILLAQVYKAQKNYPQAISCIERAISINPNNPSLPVVAGEVYEAAQNKDKAIQYYVQAAQLFKKELDVENCLTYVQKLKGLAPEDAVAYSIEGDLKLSLGDYQGAVKSYETGRDIAPDDDATHQKLAFAYQQGGEDEKALKGFEKALALNPKNVEAHIGLGDLNREEKKYDEAIRSYSQAKKLTHEKEVIVIKIAEAYTAANKPDKAISELNEWVKLDKTGYKVSSSNKQKVYILLADNYRKTGDNLSAKKHLEKAIAIDPDYVPAYQALGMVESSLGKKEAAAEAFAKAKLLDPSLTIPANLLPTPKKEEIVIVLNEDFIQFVQTFPVEPSKEIAPIILSHDILKPGLFPRLKAQMGFIKEDWGALYEEFKKTLSVQYKLISPDTLKIILNNKPFKQMNRKDMDDDNYLKLLSEALGAEGIFFFRAEKIKPPEEGKNFKLHGCLFDTSQKKRWENSVAIYYPEETLRKINWPFSTLIFLILAGGLAYGIIYFRQGVGNIQVYINRDPKTSAYFSVKISKNPNMNLTQMKSSLRKDIEGMGYSRKAQFGSKTEKSMVEKDCLFENIHVGHYIVYLYGVILDSAGKQIGNYQVTKKANIKRGETSELTFDFLPKTAYVGVRVLDGADPVVGAEIAIKGRSGAKYIKDDQGVFFDLEPGEYNLIINVKNKRFSKKITISSIDTYS
ncbi:MAG: tetratricopeptide repeat protein, partial [Pseudomonadota bacterium]